MAKFLTTLNWVLLVTILTNQINAEDTHTNNESKKIVCYYTNWGVYRKGLANFTPQNINPNLCTHLIYAFGSLDEKNIGLRPSDKYQDIDQDGYAQFTGLKKKNQNLKTMIVVGGFTAGSSEFSDLMEDENNRATFAKNVVRFLRQYNFDGLDIDWQYPANRDSIKQADRENHASMIKKLRQEFEDESSITKKPRLLLTMAAASRTEYIDKGYDVPKLNRYVDFLNVIGYDYHSAILEPEPKANHHSPLYSQRKDDQLTLNHTINYYLKKGADPEKLVLGIPTYGRSYVLSNPNSTDLGAPSDGPGEKGEFSGENGYLAYFEICGKIGKDKWKVVNPKKGVMGPYAYRGNQWVGYDDADMVKEKAKFVIEKGLGGIMFWTINNDDFRGLCHGKPYPLIEAGKEVLLSNH